MFMLKDIIIARTCTAFVLLIKPFVLWRSRCRCRRGLLKVPISGDRTREGFSFACFLCKKVSENKKNGIYRRRI